MFQLKIGKDGRQIMDSKPSNQLFSSTISTLGEGSVRNTEIASIGCHVPKQQNKRNAGRPVKVFNDISNITNLLPLKSFQIRDIQIKKIEEQLLQLKRSVCAYRYLEKDEVKAKQQLGAWFSEIESMFLGSLHGNCNLQETQKNGEDQQKVNRARALTTRQMPKLPSSLQPCHQQEVQALRQELEVFRRDSQEEMKKLEEVSSLFMILKGKYNGEKQANQTLNEAIQLYIEECDSILQRITAKYQKEKTLTTHERQVQQVLTKLKFKTFDYQYRS